MLNYIPGRFIRNIRRPSVDVSSHSRVVARRFLSPIIPVIDDEVKIPAVVEVHAPAEVFSSRQKVVNVISKKQTLDFTGAGPLEITLTGNGESELIVPNATGSSAVEIVIINKCSKAVCVTDSQQQQTIIAVDKHLKIVKQGRASYIF